MFNLFKRNPDRCDHKFTISPPRFKEDHEYKEWQKRLLKRDPIGGRRKVDIYLYTVRCKKCGFSQECEMKR